MSNKEELAVLVERISRGDKVAFGVLYDNYSGALFGVCFRILNDQAEAEDALQASMMKVWKNMNSYNSTKGSLFTWMLNVARNESIDRIRSRSRKPNIQDSDFNVAALDLAPNSSGNIPTDTIGLREEVNKLDDNLKLVIDAAYFKGFTQKEISEKFDIPLGTVKTRMRSAIKELRKLFN